MRNQNIAVLVKKSSRARYPRITVRTDGSVLVTQPSRVSSLYIENLVDKKWSWIEEKVNFFLSNPAPAKIVPSRTHAKKHFNDNKKLALELVTERMSYFNQFYNLKWNNVSIRNQKTRWGSCSKKGNLNFSYKILFLTREQQNYIIIHEMCHLTELNHGARFWALVAKQSPNFKGIRRDLRKMPI